MTNNPNIVVDSRPRKTPKPILTDVHLRHLVTAKKPVTKAQGEVKGLSFCVTAKGHASWIFRYYHRGTQKELTLGSYPAVSLRMAKNKAEAAREAVEAGKDPGLAKQIEKIRRNEAETIGELCKSYLTSVAADLKPKTIEDKTTYVGYASTILGSIPAEDLEPQDVVGFVKRIGKEHTPKIADKCLVDLRAVIRHGIGRGAMKTDPSLGLKASEIAGKGEPRRARLKLSFEELTALLHGLPRDENGNLESGVGVLPKDEVGLLLRLLLATGARITEMLEAPWSEFDLEDRVWYLPESRAKNGKAIAIPLTDACVGWLQDLKPLSRGSSWLFPRVLKKTSTTVTRCRTGVRKKFVSIAEERGVRVFVPHDLRSTMRSWLGALKVPLVVAERCLNHTVGGLVEVYDVHDYFDERRAAVQEFSEVLVAAEEGRGWKRPETSLTKIRRVR